MLPSADLLFYGLFIVLDGVFLGSTLSVDVERGLNHILCSSHELTSHSKLRVRAVRPSPLAKLPLLGEAITSAVLSSYESTAWELATNQLTWHKSTVATLITLLEVLGSSKLEACGVLVL